MNVFIKLSLINNKRKGGNRNGEEEQRGSDGIGGGSVRGSLAGCGGSDKYVGEPDYSDTDLRFHIGA